jgi:hypothetical protein
MKCIHFHFPKSKGKKSPNVSKESKRGGEREGKSERRGSN